MLKLLLKLVLAAVALAVEPVLVALELLKLKLLAEPALLLELKLLLKLLARAKARALRWGTQKLWVAPVTWISSSALSWRTSASPSCYRGSACRPLGLLYHCRRAGSSPKARPVTVSGAGGRDAKATLTAKIQLRAKPQRCRSLEWSPRLLEL